MKLLILGFYIAVFCSLGFADNSKDATPKKPPFWEIFTVNGVDSDNDGVRDDIEIWINSVTDDENRRMALKKIANSYTRLNDSLGDKKIYIREKMRFTLRNYCWKFVTLNLKSNKHVFTFELHEKMLNTPLREYYFKKGFSNLPGGVVKVPEVSPHMYGVACEFTIRNARKIIEEYLQANPQYKWEEKEKKEFKDIYETKSLVIDPYFLFRMERRRI